MCVGVWGRHAVNGGDEIVKIWGCGRDGTFTKQITHFKPPFVTFEATELSKKRLKLINFQVFYFEKLPEETMAPKYDKSVPISASAGYKREFRPKKALKNDKFAKILLF